VNPQHTGLIKAIRHDGQGAWVCQREREVSCTGGISVETKTDYDCVNDYDPSLSGEKRQKKEGERSCYERFMDKERGGEEILKIRMRYD